MKLSLIKKKKFLVGQHQSSAYRLKTLGNTLVKMIAELVGLSLLSLQVNDLQGSEICRFFSWKHEVFSKHKATSKQHATSSLRGKTNKCINK